MRTSERRRKTLETDVYVKLALNGQGKAEVETGIGFLDHMLHAFCRFGHFDLVCQVQGDTHVDAHHTIEDCGIVLGQAFQEALENRAGIERVGDCLFPMDEALVQVALDLSNRGYLAWNVSCPDGMVGDFPVEMAEEFFRALATNGGWTLHVNQLAGKNRHHILEAIFKGVGRALGLAARQNPLSGEILSTKGLL